MIKKLYKKISPIILSTLVLTNCESKGILNRLIETKKFLHNSTEQFEKNIKPSYDNSLLKKWYNLQDQRIFAEKKLGPDDYESYDIVIPFSGKKWTRTSYAPLIGDLFKKYIGFKESWPEHKKEHHLKHYNIYLEDFLQQIGKDADTNKDDILTKIELEELKKLNLIKIPNN